MAISVNWATKVIYVPQSFLTFLSGDRWELDVDAFRLALKDIEDSEEGCIFPDTHRHNTSVTLSGVTYARTFEIINGYTIQFEDKGAHYTIVCTGANHNLGDVLVPGATHLIIGNSAGLITVVQGSGVTEQDKQDIAALVWANAGSWAYQLGKTFGGLMIRLRAFMAGKSVGHTEQGGHVEFKGIDNTTTVLEADLDQYGNRSNVDAHGE